MDYYSRKECLGGGGGGGGVWYEKMIVIVEVGQMSQYSHMSDTYSHSLQGVGNVLRAGLNQGGGPMKRKEKKTNRESENGSGKRKLTVLEEIREVSRCFLL